MVYRKNKILFIFILLLFISSCYNERDKIKYRGTKKLANNLYVEFYEPMTGGAGPFSGSLTNAYLTDSMINNIFLGSVHDDEDFNFSLNSTIVVSRRYRLITIDFNKPPKKEYFDSIYIDLKTFKIIKNN